MLNQWKARAVLLVSIAAEITPISTLDECRKCFGLDNVDGFLQGEDQVTC